MDLQAEWKKDLTIGEQGEEAMKPILEEKYGPLTKKPGAFKPYDFFNEGIKIEVKTDAMSKKTGNIAIEYMEHDKPTGISTTEADRWVHLYYSWVKKCPCYLDVPVEDLKIFLKENSKKLKRVRGGDIYNGQKVGLNILVPVRRVHTDLADFVYPVR